MVEKIESWLLSKIFFLYLLFNKITIICSSNINELDVLKLVAFQLSNQKNTIFFTNKGFYTINQDLSIIDSHPNELNITTIERSNYPFFTQFSKEEDGNVFCLIFNTLYIFNSEGKFLTSKFINEIPSIPVYHNYIINAFKKSGDDYYYIILNNDALNSIKYYYFKINKNFENTLIYNNSFKNESEFLTQSVCITCQRIINANNLICFYQYTSSGTNYVSEITFTPDDNFAYIDPKKSFLNNNHQQNYDYAVSASNEDGSRIYVCYTSQIYNGTCFYFNTITREFSKRFIIGYKCNGNNYFINLNYITTSNKFIFSCKDYEFTFSFVLFNEDMNSFETNITIAFPDFYEIDSFSLIYSFNSNKFLLFIIGKNSYDSNIFEIKKYEISKFVILSNESELYKNSDIITTNLIKPTEISITNGIIESSQIIVSTQLKEPIPITESTKIIESIPITESTKIIESSQIIISTQLKEPIPITESTKIIESIPKTESTKIIKTIPITESTKIIESIPITESTKITESIPITESNKLIISSQIFKTELITNIKSSEITSSTNIINKPSEARISTQVITSTELADLKLTNKITEFPEVRTEITKSSKINVFTNIPTEKEIKTNTVKVYDDDYCKDEGMKINDQGNCVCNNENGYYPIIINNNIYYNKKCYNNETKPENFYLNKERKQFEMCNKYCRTCNFHGNEEQNNCTSCIDNYQFIPDIKYANNCFAKCEYYYYFDIYELYSCTSNYQCPGESNLLIRKKNKCIDDCSKDDTYQYQYSGECYIECPDDTILNGYKCEVEKKNLCSLSIYNLSLTFNELIKGNIDIYAKNYAEEFNYTNNKIMNYTNKEYSLVFYKNVFCIKELSLTVPQIDFGDCYKKVQFNYNITEDLLIAILDKYLDNGNPITSYLF